jgi:hypothetical protein
MEMRPQVINWMCTMSRNRILPAKQSPVMNQKLHQQSCFRGVNIRRFGRTKAPQPPRSVTEGCQGPA